MQQEKLHHKMDRQKKYLEDAIHKLTAISGNNNASEEVTCDDLLVKACQLVAKKIKINIVVPRKEKLEESSDPLAEIAKASRIRYRQVTLNDEWWKKDNGSLLAFAKEDNHPIALIPVSANKYIMVDTANNASTPVNKRTAQQIKSLAYTFYRPFPAKVIGLKELLLLSFESATKRDVLVILCMGLLGGLIGMVNPVVTGVVIDSVVPQADRMQLFSIGLLLLSFVMGKASFELTRSVAMLRMEGCMENFSQAAIWDRLISLPASFFRDYNAGELAMRANGISQIRQVLSDTTLSTVVSGVFSIFNGMLMFYYNTKLALIGIGLILIAIIISLVLGFLQIRYERENVTTNNKISGLMLQIIGGISKFRVSGSEHRAFYQWAKLFSKQRKIRFTKERISNILDTFNNAFPVITTMVMFFILGSYTKDISLSTGQFIAFNSSYGIFTMAMIELSDTFLTINVIIPTYESTKPIRETLPEYDENKEDPGELDGEIEVGHVTFRYGENGPAILKDISFKINKGEYVAIVGPSGCGKSTLLRVLLGFEKPESGKIYYSEKDLESVDIRSVRKQLGVVLQNGQLMSNDIFNNIVGSNPNLTLEDAQEAARMAGLDEDIRRMPINIETIYGKGYRIIVKEKKSMK